MSEPVAMKDTSDRGNEASTPTPSAASQRPASSSGDSNAGPPGETPSVSWQDVKSVQNLIERCLQKFMTQTEIIAALQVEANVDPSFTCLVWQKLEQQNPEFFFSYHTRLKMRDQIVAFNYLVDQQVYLIRMASGGMMPPPGMPPPAIQSGMMTHHPLAQHPGFPQGMPMAVPPARPPPAMQGTQPASQGVCHNPLSLPQGPPPQRPHGVFPSMPHGAAITSFPFPTPSSTMVTAAPVPTPSAAPTLPHATVSTAHPTSAAARALSGQGQGQSQGQGQGQGQGQRLGQGQGQGQGQVKGLGQVQGQGQGQVQGQGKIQGQGQGAGKTSVSTVHDRCQPHGSGASASSSQLPSVSAGKDAGVSGGGGDAVGGCGEERPSQASSVVAPAQGFPSSGGVSEGGRGTTAKGPGEGQDEEAGRKSGGEGMDVDVGGDYIDIFRA